MTDKRFRTMDEIEAAQEALRDSIMRTKDLAEQTENLLQKHRQALAVLGSGPGGSAAR